MQPLENKRTKTQTGVARARLLLKRDLGWLPGYPLKVANIDGNVENTLQWQSERVNHADTPQVWQLDGEYLRRAQMALSKLRHHFHRALPKIVEDVEDWLQRTDFLLALLKGFVHHGRTFCADDVLRSGLLPVRWTNEMKRMKSTHGSLNGLLDAVMFLALSDRRNCELDSLAWIDMHAAEFTLLCNIDQEHSYDLSIGVLSVRENLSSDLMSALVRCWTEPVIRECRWEHAEGWLLELRSEILKALKQHECDFPQIPSDETLGQLVRSVFADACVESPKTQRTTFQLLEQILTAELVDHVAETQQQIASGEKRLSKLLRQNEARHPSLLQTMTDRNELKKQVTMEAESVAGETATIKALGKCLGGMKNVRSSGTQDWIDLLAAFPREHAALRVRLLAKWWRHWHILKDRQNDFSRVIRAFAALTRRRGIAPSILKHWYDFVDDSHSCNEFVFNTYYELPGNRRLEVRTVRLLERVAYDLQLNLGRELLCSMAEFAQATEDEKFSCSLIEHLAKEPDKAYNANDLRLAYHYGDSIDVISDVLTALQSTNELTDLATQLKPLADDPDLKRIVSKRLAENDVGTLSRIAATLAILNDVDHPIPKREAILQPTDWMDRYPGDYQSVLQTLAKVTCEAQQIAENVLGKAFPTSAVLLPQIEALESKLAAGVPNQADEVHMYRRLANLRRRKAQPASVSPARRDKLIEKLKRRTESEILERYASTCGSQAAEAMQKRFDLKEIPDEWWQPPLDRVLRQINRLSGPMQELGIRLLFETLERTTCNFDEEPKNVAFRARMEASGVLMQPWLSAQVKQPAFTADGTPYELAFTRDVIDILLMGFHFDTCLSPDSFNFFSTVANAVDLNKRVVYGKTKAGKVIGRCLFALNDSGEILTYHRYSHEPKDGFANAVELFAGRLAASMQTCLVTSGNVSKLVARQWYDDGPWQSDADWLSDDGTLARLLKDVSHEELLPELCNAMGREFLKRRVSELAIDARVRHRAEFLQPLLDEFEDEMSLRQKFIVAVNVEPVTVRHRLLCQLRWTDIVGLVNRHQCDECDVFHGIAEYSRVFGVLNELHPSLALRAIRASRPSSIKSDMMDPNYTRRTALAQAHRMLGRHELAQKLIVT